MFDMIAVGEILIDLVGTGDLRFRDRGWSALQRSGRRPPSSGAGPLSSAWSEMTRSAVPAPISWTNWKIDRTYLAVTQQADTTLAFVTLDKNGDRDFTFYRRPGAGYCCLL